MLKNVTFSADENLIRKARQRAAEKKTTLNAEFRLWLEEYAEHPRSSSAFPDLMNKLSYAQPGRKFLRDEMNER